MSLESFFQALPFEPDEFQLEAAGAIADGASVVVTAPTGAGKTLIAEAAVHLSLEAGDRAFYTAPIKALSNQKYADFKAIYGDDNVGLLTGDNSINGSAPLVVMTTEVLRNMIYAESESLAGLGVAVLDEVHYLQDRARGQVWEEIIIHLPQGIPLVCLSATIANPPEFTAWVESRRGATRLVVEDHRPVPLESLYLVKDRSSGLDLYPVLHRGRPNQVVLKRLRKGRGKWRRYVTPRRLEVVDVLIANQLLPVIYFVFSRVGCEAAAEQVVGAGLRFTTTAEREEIRRRAEARTSHLDQSDLAVLGYERWVHMLELGVAAHHAGMVPAFKETVEELFVDELISVVFATETLSLGINMPARTVVLERLTKFTGEAHELLQPGDYTQLTGRAGRRGIDDEGTAVVLHSPHVPFDRVAAIALAKSHPLRSSFQPTYNMAVNLVANYPQDRAEELLNASFAQFRAATSRQRLEAELAKLTEQRETYRRAAECERGDIFGLDDLGGAADVGRDTFIQTIGTGDVLHTALGRSVVLARGFGASPRLLLVTEDGQARRVASRDLGRDLAREGTMELPEPFQPRDAAYQAEVSTLLSNWSGTGEPERPDGLAPDDGTVAMCPDLAEHRTWVQRAKKVEKDIRRVERRMSRRDESLVSRFRAILGVLDAEGYTAGWSLLPRGEQLRFIYSELDVPLVEAVAQGVFSGLNAPEVAALLTAFVYEARLSDEPGSWPTALLAERGDVAEAIIEDLNHAERERGLPETRAIDPGFAAAAYYWASGVDLEDLIGDDEFTAGDFVRNSRQLLDILRQVRDVFTELAPVATEALRQIDRGVVAAGGQL